MSLHHGALTGLKVVDASRVLGGPICGQMLGDHGAEVLKIESPAGDDTRAWSPPNLGPVSAYFSGANRNKSTQVLDFNQAADFAQFTELLRNADVLIENFRPESASKWGLTREFTAALNPRLIHCRVSGFGDVGPMAGLPAYDTAMQALCGLMSVNGTAESGPMRVGLPVVDMTTGLNAMIGILLALQARHATGLGQLVETTLFANAVSLLHPHASNYFGNGAVPRLSGNAHPNIYPYDAITTRTGSIYMAVGNDRQFATLCDHLGLAALAQQPEFASNPQRSIHRESLRSLLQEALQTENAVGLADTLVRKGVPCAAVQDVAQLLASEQAQAAQIVVEMGNGYRGIASPIQLSDTPASYRKTPPVFPGR